MTLARLRTIAHVAVWEFRRFYKLRDQLLSLLLAVVGGAIGFGVQYFVGKAAGSVKVAVIGGDRLPELVLPPTSKLELTHHAPSDELQLRDAVGRRRIDGLLIIAGPDGAELFVAKEPVWQRDLQTALTDARSRDKLKLAALDAGQVKELFAPLPLAVAYHPAGRGASSLAEKLLAAMFVGLTCLGVFLGMASFFAGITGEKAMRVTEQVVAAISPQTWVDGKLVGLTAAAFGSLLTYAVALSVFLGILWLGGASFSIPWTAVRPGNLLLYALLSFLGLFFWNCAFAAIAVTINDPNSSARSSLMFLPLMFVGMGFPGLQTPDSNVMKALSVLPGTSPTVMTVRLVLSDVQTWEVLVSIGLMILAIGALRRVAGAVFAANILLTGKELSWGEMWRGLRQSIIAEALALVQKNAERYYEAELYRLQGEFVLALARTEPGESGARMAEAESCFQQALEVARRQHAKSLELRASLSLGHLWYTQGRPGDVRRLLTEIYSWFTEGFDTPDLQAAQVLLQA